MKKKAFFLPLLVSIFIYSGCAYYNTLFNAKKNFNQAIDTIQNSADPKTAQNSAKNFFEATIDKCWKLIEIYGDNSKYADDALLYISKSEYYLERYTQSKLHLEQFIQKYNQSNLLPEAYLWLGKTLIALNDYDKANEHLLQVITESKDKKIRSEAYFELGNYAYKNQNYETAIDYFEKALKEKPDDQYRALLQFYLGEAFYIQKEYEKAIEQFKKVSDYSPTTDIEYQTGMHMARSYIELQKYKNAREVLRKMLTAPRFQNFLSQIKTTLAEIDEKQGNYVDAIDNYKNIINEKKPDAGTAHAALNLARIYENIYNNIDSAVVYYEKVGTIYSRFDSIHIANEKKVFLRELKELRDAVRKDSRLVHLITTDSFFRDSLYKAQLEDSLREVYGIEDPASDFKPLTFGDSLSDTLWQDQNEDSLLFGNTEDPNDPFSDQNNQDDPFSEENNQNDPFANDPFQNNLDSLSENQDGAKGDSAGQKDSTTERSKNRENEDKVPRKEVEKRKLPEIKKDLKENRFRLAEYFLLNVENYDSAAYHFNNFVEQYEDSVLTPRALYSLIFIHSKPEYQNQRLVDSLETIILEKYPNSRYAHQILKQRGILATTKTENPDSLEINAHRLFLEAESLYFAHKVDSALKLYREVAEIDSASKWSAKAQYAIAWIYEREYQNIEQAIEAYSQLASKYDEATVFAEVARRKITVPKEPDTTLAEQVIPEGEEDVQEGTAEEEVSSTEPAFSREPETLQTVGQASRSWNFSRKVQWRRQRILTNGRN